MAACGATGARAAGTLLMLGGEVMKDGTTVADYDFPVTGAVLHVAWPKIWVKVQRSSQRGKSEIKVLVKPSTTVASLKQTIAARLRIRPEYQHLTTVDGQELIAGLIAAHTDIHQDQRLERCAHLRNCSDATYGKHFTSCIVDGHIFPPANKGKRQICSK